MPYYLKINQTTLLLKSPDWLSKFFTLQESGVRAFCWCHTLWQWLPLINLVRAVALLTIVVTCRYLLRIFYKDKKITPAATHWVYWCYYLQKNGTPTGTRQSGEAAAEPAGISGWQPHKKVRVKSGSFIRFLQQSGKNWTKNPPRNLFQRGFLWNPCSGLLTLATGKKRQKKWYAHGDSTKRRSRCRASRNIRLAPPPKKVRVKSGSFIRFLQQSGRNWTKKPLEIYFRGDFCEILSQYFWC